VIQKKRSNTGLKQSAMVTPEVRVVLINRTIQTENTVFIGTFALSLKHFWKHEVPICIDLQSGFPLIFTEFSDSSSTCVGKHRLNG